MPAVLRTALACLLLCVWGAVAAQSDVLVAPLPKTMQADEVMALARAALAARSWRVLSSDATSLSAQNGNSQIRVFVSGDALRYSDEPGREPAPQRLLATLRADLASAIGQDVAAARPAAAAPAAAASLGGRPFMSKPADLDAATFMRAVRIGLQTRRFTVLSDSEDGVITAQQATRNVSATWKLYLVGDQLMLADTATRLSRRGETTEPAESPAHWFNNVRADIEKAVPQARQEQADGRAQPPQRVVREAQTPAASEPARGNATERLRTLKQLFDSGAITRDEYDRKRAEILRDL